MNGSRGKLLNLTLVDKYYPMANYSYPRKNNAKDNSRPPRDLYAPRSNRSSLGSDGSAPGLIDDHTDNSEVSLDDDYQRHHAHAAQLWDSFWSADGKPLDAKPVEEVKDKKEYSALLSPTGSTLSVEPQRNANWPLPNSPPPQQSRKPAATYSRFPRTSRPALPRPSSSQPSWLGSSTSRPSSSSKDISRPSSAATLQVLQPSAPPRPRRPSRPSLLQLTPCVEEETPHITSPFVPSPRPLHSGNLVARPLTSDGRRSRAFSPIQDRPATSYESSKPFSSDSAHTIVVVPQSPLLTPSPTSQLFPSPPMGVAPPRPLRPDHPSVLERQSYFDWDDDEDEEEPALRGEDGEGEPPSSATRRFFRFHRRGESEAKSKKDHNNVSMQRRNRAKTAPSEKSQKRQGAYFNRMLGRRSG